jgi:hypothetical protein
MARRYFGGMLFVVLASVVFAGCKKDESPVEVTDAPALPVVVFHGPLTASTHAEAQKVKTTVSSFNYFTTSFSAFDGAPISVSGNTYTRTIKDGDLTFRLTATRQDNHTVLWKLYLDGRESNGTTYAHWLATEGVVDEDLKNAAWVNYEENKTTKASEFFWTVNSAASLIGTLKVYTDGQLTAQSILMDNANNTGELKQYTGSVLTYRAIWLASGNGQYWYYDANGLVTSQGTWS